MEVLTSTTSPCKNGNGTMTIVRTEAGEFLETLVGKGGLTTPRLFTHTANPKALLCASLCGATSCYGDGLIKFNIPLYRIVGGFFLNDHDGFNSAGGNDLGPNRYQGICFQPTANMQCEYLGRMLRPSDLVATKWLGGSGTMRQALLWRNEGATSIILTVAQALPFLADFSLIELPCAAAYTCFISLKEIIADISASTSTDTCSEDVLVALRYALEPHGAYLEYNFDGGIRTQLHEVDRHELHIGYVAFTIGWPDEYYVSFGKVPGAGSVASSDPVVVKLARKFASALDTASVEQNKQVFPLPDLENAKQDNAAHWKNGHRKRCDVQ
ncbi:MAG: hypothetical protein LBI39_03150 [Puniceicoccales bacterium]|nr:hypothetical protein [Puniceicoccales bacterium]